MARSRQQGRRQGWPVKKVRRVFLARHRVDFRKGADGLLGEALADSEILGGDDTSCRVLEVSSYFEQQKRSGGAAKKRKPPWSEYGTTAKPSAGDVIVQADLSTTNLIRDSELLKRFDFKLVGCSAHARRPFALYEHEDPVYCPFMLHLFQGAGYPRSAPLCAWPQSTRI